MTKDEAQRAVEAELAALNPKTPMSPVEMLKFCQKMYARLDFKSKRADRLSEIRNWAERWEAMWLPRG
jgi:hypothetical protein